MRKRTFMLVALAALMPAGASAQSVERLSMDGAVSATQTFGRSAGDRPDVIIDFTATTRIGRGWVAYVRPWFRQASTAPHDFARTIYQAAVQHERAGRVSTRLDLGYILTPIGIGMMDMRPDTNPVTQTHLSYVIPMPPAESGAPGTMPVASSYPLGAILTASAQHWDVRGGVTAAPPNRTYLLGAATPNPRLRPFAVVGGGITPRTGLRLGTAYGVGEYATAAELTGAPSGGRDLHILAVEGEVSFAYTKVTAEMTRSLMELRQGREARATQWFVQGVQTLAPRWFLGLRREAANAPPNPVYGPRPTLRVAEASLGYRLSNELIVKNAFVTRKTYYSARADRQYAVSLVWAKRFR